jgi:hypothetical protein
MSVVEALKAARAAGVELALDGDDLALKAASAPPTAVLDALSRHKAEIVVLLRPAEPGWSAEDWQVFFDERAGIIEFDGGLPRSEAEALAFDCCVAEWLNRNPERSPAEHCPGCGDHEHAHDPLTPYCVAPNGHALAAFALLARLERGPESQGCVRGDDIGISAPGAHAMKLEEQSKHLQSHVTRESRGTAKI